MRVDPESVDGEQDQAQHDEHEQEPYPGPSCHVGARVAAMAGEAGGIYGCRGMVMA